MSDEMYPEAAEVALDEELDETLVGFNPQPDPPARPEFGDTGLSA